MAISETRMQEIIARAERQFSSSKGSDGIFETMEQAIQAAKQAQKQYAALPMEQRAKVIKAMREAALAEAEALSRMAAEETGFGRWEDKVVKNKLAAEKTPGTEDLHPVAYTGDWGMTLVEQAPFGVIGAITPSTNPTATVINNAIGMAAAGNGVVFNAHPGAKNCANATVRLLNKAIASVTGISCLLCSVENPSQETAGLLFTSPDIRLLVATGGEEVVRAAMTSGKKTIGAGPGNPPVIVDDTACISKAARDIVDGASFDNNVLCIAEKEVFVFEAVADVLVAEMQKNGAYLVGSGDLQRLADAVLIKTPKGYAPNKKFVGKDADVILSAMGISFTGKPRLVICRVEEQHPLVSTEMLMPVLPVIAVKNMEGAIAAAVRAENNCHHTAIMHSENVAHLTAAAKALDTTIFVKNAPSYAGLGMRGEGYTSLTIATPTGEGLTSAKNFSRVRRCTLSEGFRIV